MIAAILFTGSGPVAILTTHRDLNTPDLLARLDEKGIRKYVAFPIPIELARERYGHHYTAIVEEPGQSDELRILDEDGNHIFLRFRFEEYGKPIFHEPAAV